MNFLSITVLIAGVTLFSSSYTYATVKEAFEISKNDKSKNKNKKIAHELIDAGFYFSAIPFINNYLEENNEIDNELEEDIETLVLKTGTMAVLNLEEKKLENFSIPSISLILGTRLFNKDQLDKAYTILSRIPETHKFSIEAGLIKGTIKNLQGKRIEASNFYDQCLKKAAQQESSISGEKLKRYYTYLKETCTIRMARVKLEDKKYEEALEIYERIDKRSYKWPYILMDKAWAHYYLKDYNRSIGLTVTYKSPLLESYFFPESEVLMALSYYNLCLWDDSLKVVDHFYDYYQPKADALKDILGQNKMSDTYFLDLYYADPKTRENLNPFIRNLITQTRKQVKFNLDLSSLSAAKSELLLLKKLKNKNDFTQNLEENIDSTIKFISAKINYYIKKEIFTFINEIHKHSFSMFNLKLELLSKKREDIYNTKLDKKSERDRGSENNVNRKANQYFFDFNGSFWADELGDYSFGLQSQCKPETQPTESNTEVKSDTKIESK
jgi:tetratricopeptide (TPR) repeat protein